MTQTLIEKLERLLHQDLGDIKSDLRAIIEQAKAEQQPTPQDVIDAERYRELLRQETGLRYAQKPVIKSAIDQAMKGE